ncbi:MAG: hypothetical protein MJ200_03790 [Mycoplasmoidaceae bacterium]|nr:hypothetical protein [Mycoplasmoidaceae bacterium]
MVIDEGAFRFAPVTTLKLPNHLAGTFSGPDLEDYANGPFANMVNLDMIDLSTVTYEAATKLAVKLSWGCFNGTGKDPVEGQQQCAILFNPDLSPQQVEGISATFFNCGLDKDK